MRPAIKLSQGWLDARGWSLAEGAALLEIDQANAVAAGTADACPKCERPNTEYQGWAFAPDPASANSEHERGRAYILCICGALYWYAAVDVLDAPTEDARVRASSATITPGTGALQVEGQAPKIAEPLPPGANNTLDVANRIASQFRPEFYAAIQAQIDNNTSYMLALRAHELHRRKFIAAFTEPLGPPNPAQ